MLIALPLSSDPYLPLRPSEYQIRREGSHEAVPGEQAADLRMLVRYDRLTPIPLLWTGWFLLMALTVVGAVPQEVDAT